MRKTAIQNGTVSGRSKSLAKGNLEDSISGMAESGELQRAARQAVRRQRRKGLPITRMRGERIVKRHSDGREEVLGEVKAVPFARPAGVEVIGHSTGHGKR